MLSVAENQMLLPETFAKSTYVHALILQFFDPDRLSVKVQESGHNGTIVPIKYLLLQDTTDRMLQILAGNRKHSLKATMENTMEKAALVAQSALIPSAQCVLHEHLPPKCDPFPSNLFHP
ncbi:hypothetical protein IV203_026231 [Nitzschia inconspicua]|uniref:Uncharacterized protein n=1 Tax=Nitzschia inconspicua TaxID=303405 RepID=A0A9K3LLA7_9STRA|nr:hypothetical protein IV203_026231 [Nitzschia inconspicua]